MTELSANHGLTIYYVLCQCVSVSVYWKHFQNIHTFIYQKTLLLTLFLLALKIVESLHYILKNKYNFTSYQKNIISYWLSINLNQSKLYIFKYTLYIPGPILALCVPSEFFSTAKDVCIRPWCALPAPILSALQQQKTYIYVLLLFHVRQKYFHASNQGRIYTSFMYFASSHRRIYTSS